MPADDNLQIFKDYKNNNFFLETGAYYGVGIQQALDAGYENIVSIELSEHYYNLCKQKFQNNKNVNLVLGDSADVLALVLRNIDEPITFWLDGHYSCGNTAKGKYWSPLMQELDAISKHPCQTHTIIIDDMRCWNVNNPNHPFSWVQIEEKIKGINSNYIFTYLKTKEEYYPTQHDWPEGLLGDILIASIG